MTGETIRTARTTEIADERRSRPRHRSNLMLRLALVVIAFAALVAVIGPLLAPFGAPQTVSTESFSYPPTAAFLGTDYLGRDLLSRLLYGARLTLGTSLVTTILAFALGATSGFLAAVARGWVDQILGRIVDALLAVPSIILALLVISALGTSIIVLISTVALIEALRVFRLARAVAIDISVMDFIDVARARGENVFWIMSREILPNTMAPLGAEFGLRFTYTILFISALSFLGLGVQPPNADWGVMVKENIQGLLYGSPAALMPAACIAAVTVSVNLLVDCLLQRSNAKSSVDMPL